MQACDDLLALLSSLDIPVTFQEHAAVMTVAESAAVRKTLGGLLCKCLFCKSHDGTHWLLAVPADVRVDLKKAATLLQCGRLSFASPEELLALLGITPGAVTLFGVINDKQHLVRVVIDESLAEAGQRLYFHPLVNTATVGIFPDGLLTFLRHTGHPPVIAPVPAL